MTKTTKKGRAVARAETKKKSDAEAEALADLRDEVARDEVRALRKELDALRSVVDDLREVPGDPSIVPQLVRRDIFREGRRLSRERADAVVRLHDARREYQQADRAFERLKAELARGGGPFADGSFARDDEDRLRKELAQLNEERKDLWAAVEEARADVEEAEAALRPFTTVYTYGLHLGDVEIQE